MWTWDTVWVHLYHQSFSSLTHGWMSYSVGGKLQRCQARRRYRRRRRNVFLFQWFATFLDSLYLPSLSLSLSHSQCEFLSGSLTFCLPLLPSSPLLLVNTHYSLQTQWQFSPPAIWDQYWVSSTTSWPDILISVIQTKYCAFCPPTRQPTVYSPSEWLKSNVEH